MGRSTAWLNRVLVEDVRSSYVRLAPEAGVPRATPAPVLVMSLLAPAILPGLDQYRPVTSLSEFIVRMRNRMHWNVPDAVHPMSLN